jgi:ribosomal protein S12 methylthiotransferase accessory factor
MRVPSSLTAAAADAARCGVTRLADVTGLDRIGMPVFQSVRPLSRALSVHQGKGLSREAAMIGALMEAVESHHAETFAGDPIVGSFDALPARARSASVTDFACDREDSPGADAPIAWVPARRLIGDRLLMVPFDVVSLDCTRSTDPRIDKSSVGLAAHYDRRAAMLTAIYEVIERDAEWVWRGLPIGQRSLCRIDARSVPFEWFQRLRATIRREGIRLTLYQIPAVIRLPVFICELTEPGAGAAARHIVYGSAAHDLPEQSLLRSVVEAVQSRATVIAGVRDDIYYREASSSGGDSIGLCLPLPLGFAARAWADVVDRFDAPARPDPVDLARRLAWAGYPDTAIVDISGSDTQAVVIKAVSPGLGAFGRRRRVVEPRRRP